MKTVEKFGFLNWITKKGRWLPLLALLLGVLLLFLPSALSRDDNGSAEEKIEQLCSAVDGVGECRVLLSLSDDGKSVVAVAVICEGGDNLLVRHRLTELLSSFYGIGYNRIRVEKMR